jgi:hypothetical protein
MIELKIPEMIQTICIGVFTTILFLYFYFLYCKMFKKNKFNEEEFNKWIKTEILDKNFKETGYFLISLVFVYLFGIVAGSLTDRMTDSNNPNERNCILKELNYVSCMPSIGEIRKLVLIDSEGFLTTLGNSVFKTQKLVKEANEFNGTNFFLNETKDSMSSLSTQQLVQKYLKDDKLNEKCNLNPSSFEKFIDLLYYTSKNWCYTKEQEALNELTSIQISIDLTRSMVLLAAISIQLILLLYLLFIAINYKDVFSAIKVKEFKEHLNSINQTVFKSLFVLVFTVLLCKESFKINLMNYNKRAFGYYVTYLAKPK